MATILVVEDDTIINQVICEFLKEHGYQVTPVFDGQAALDAFENEDFDLLILDIMIPKITGLEVLKNIRRHSKVPVLMLTAMDDEYTQLASFNAQISDYVVKPFSPTILMKRIENILGQQKQPEILEIGPIKVDHIKGTVHSHEEEINLTKKEYDILVFFLKHKGQIISRETLMQRIWKYDDLYSRVLDNHIKNLRKKLPELPIKTVIGRGYCLEGED